jgi:hypothetical protein
MDIEKIIIESNRGKKQLVLNYFKFWISVCNKEIIQLYTYSVGIQLKTYHNYATA